MNQQATVVAMAKEIEARTTKTRERFQTFETDVLLAIAKGEISAVEAAKHELAARGLGAKGLWVGFERARAFWRTAFWSNGTLMTVPEDAPSGSRWIVMCRVSGGVTGTRESELKSSGAIQYFETREAAQAKAMELNTRMNHAHSVASFRYWPVEA